MASPPAGSSPALQADGEAASSSGGLRLGPATGHDLLCWPTRVLDDLGLHDAAKGTDLHKRCLEAWAKGVVITSSYSGIGGAETAAAACSFAAEARWAQQQPQRSTGKGGFHGAAFYSGCEFDPLPRRCLQAHPACSRPAHIFEDVLDRVSRDCRAQLQHILDQCRRRHEVATAGRPKEEEKAMREDMGNEMVAQMLELLTPDAFLEKAFCVSCGQACFINPRQAGCVPPGAQWCEVAGTTCVSWSNMGGRGGWLHESTVPALVWAMSMRAWRPDLILHECAPAFDGQVLDCILNGFDLAIAQSVPKQSLSRGCALEHNTGTFAMQTAVFCPRQLGAGAMRKRRYSAWHLRANAVPDASTQFSDVFFKQPRLTGSCYFVLDDSQARAALAKSAAKRSWPGSGGSEEPSHKELLPAAFRVRLAAYAKAAARQGLVDKEGNWCMSSCFVNASQTVGFAGLPRSPCVGALIKNSVVFDLVSERLLTPVEHFAVQGYSPPGCSKELVPEEWVRFFPCLGILGELSDGDVRFVTGNGMNMLALSAWLTHALAATRPPAAE